MIMSHKGFTLEELTKLEGHAKLNVDMKGGKVNKVWLEVYEASRYFEAMLLGRDYREAPSITQRICGICSVVHTLTSIKAVEDAFGITPSQQTLDLRKLLLYASTIHSHTAHLFFFALPDYLGFSDVIELSQKKHEHIHLALDLQQLASDIVKLVGGRALHPVTPVIGGFTSVPDKAKIGAIRKNLEAMKKLAKKTAEIFAPLKLPALDIKAPQLCLKKANEYALYDGTITSSDGSFFRGGDYKKHIKETIRPYSNSKHSSFQGGSYMTGALPRLNSNWRYLSDDAGSILAAAGKAGMKPPIYNPFANNFAQAVEMVHFTDEALHLTEKYAKGMRGEKFEALPKKTDSEGVGVCEAPRGLLLHNYGIGSDGKIRYANVITPTSQNAARMEDDIAAFLPSILKKPGAEVKLLLEMLIRAYDPCFSCSSHFLELKIKT